MEKKFNLILEMDTEGPDYETNKPLRASFLLTDEFFEIVKDPESVLLNFGDYECSADSFNEHGITEDDHATGITQEEFKAYLTDYINSVANFDEDIIVLTAWDNEYEQQAIGKYLGEDFRAKFKQNHFNVLETHQLIDPSFSKQQEEVCIENYLGDQDKKFEKLMKSWGNTIYIRDLYRIDNSNNE